MSRTARKNSLSLCKFGNPEGRDRKPWWKPNSNYKKMRRRIRRAKIKQALRDGRALPIFKKTDVWDWN